MHKILFNNKPYFDLCDKFILNVIFVRIDLFIWQKAIIAFLATLYVVARDAARHSTPGKLLRV